MHLEQVELGVTFTIVRQYYCSASVQTTLRMIISGAGVIK